MSSCLVTYVQDMLIAGQIHGTGTLSRTLLQLGDRSYSLPLFWINTISGLYFGVLGWRLKQLPVCCR